MKHKSSIKSAVTNELLKIGCFLLHYIIQSYQISTDAINEMFHITESLFNIQGTISGIAKRTICDITTSVLDK